MRTHDILIIVLKKEKKSINNIFYFIPSIKVQDIELQSTIFGSYSLSIPYLRCNHVPKSKISIPG